MVIYVGKKPIYFMGMDEQKERLANNMLEYCNSRLKEISQRFLSENELKILAIKLYLGTDLDLEQTYKVVFEEKDYYDVAYFCIDDELDLYIEHCCERYGIRPYSMDFFEEIVLEGNSNYEIFELALNLDEHEYNRADWFTYDGCGSLEFFNDEELEWEINNDKGFRKWLRHNEEFYNKQKEIDEIVKHWEDEYEIEF